MPTAFKAFRGLLDAGLNADWCRAIAAEIEAAKNEGAIFLKEPMIDRLVDEGGLDEAKAEALADVLRNCIWSQRFTAHFLKTPLKTALVRAGFVATVAESILAAIEPAVVTPHTPEARAPILYTPSPGRVVMCDFTFLRKPEMQKQRRAIVISPRAHLDYKRCTVVPVSKKPATDGGAYYFEFPAGKYPFFSPDDPVWAVCDHIYTVSLERLWKVNIARKPQLPMISEEELLAIRALAGTAIGHE